MTRLTKPDAGGRTDALTITVSGVLALVAVAATLGCLVYALWWLITFWAPT